VLLSEPLRTILLDIEGTTTPLVFTHDTLFPYARSHVREFLKQHRASVDVRDDLIGFEQEHIADVRAGLDPPALDRHSSQSQLECTVAYIEWLMDRDRKSTALKSLQGRIWEEGYQSGTLLAPVFADVPDAFRRWREQLRNIAIFSSGSMLAQQLLFSHTTAGDLTPYISAYFDTTTGAKINADSYRKIAATLGQSAYEIVFISDVVAELDAASAAGLQVLLCERTGNRPQPASPHRTISDFKNVLSGGGRDARSDKKR
jgi:enolase-phosphatase E1